MRDKAKRVALSSRYHRIGEAAGQMLDNTRAKYKKRAQDAERRLDEAIGTLAKHPLAEGLSARRGESVDVAALDVDRLKEYVAEVKEWMSVMRAQYVCMP